jgi:cardiolipin synthase C
VGRQVLFAALCLLQLVSCGTLVPGADYPKTESTALIDPEQTRLGGQFAGVSREHAGTSGFRILTAGVDGLLTRVQMIDAAERTLDLQYYIFRGDQTGRLLTDALLRAADRGVRVRVLVDDGGMRNGDEQIMAISGHAAIEVRVFNPFAYRGHSRLLRALEFVFNASRVDYRMHNKLLVADNTAALIGGRNIGNEYFQMDPDSQLADDDIFVAGPTARQLSVTFDEFWRNHLSIPAEALGRKSGHKSALAKRRNSALARPVTIAQTSTSDGVDYVTRIATGEPFAGMVAGRLPLVWAPAQLVSDSPDKKKVARGVRAGRLMAPVVAATASAAKTELLMVTPYFIPANEELQILKNLRLRQVPVRILTNSLESAPELSAHAHYAHFRVPLLVAGVELHEVRSLLGNARGSGQTARLSRYGNFALHAKLWVFDRQKLFVGSMNFDQRSKGINTEIGLIIDSPDLAQQTVLRFEAMAQPLNSYSLDLQPRHAEGRAELVWQTEENGQVVVYRREPARSWWDRFQVRLLAMLPIASEL